VKSVYDSENRLKEKQMRDGAKYSYTYKGNTNLLETTTGPVNSDATINQNLYQVTKNTYNDYGQLTATEQYNGNNPNIKITSSSAYSTNGKYLLSSTNELGTVTENRYDNYDNISKTIYDTDNTENSINYTYDTSDRIKTVSQKRNSSNTATVQYNYTNNQLSSINHNGFNYSFNYNNFGSVLTTNVGNNTLITNTYGKYDYNQTNNPIQLPHMLTKSTYGNGDYVEYDYDKYGRVVAEKVNGETTFTYTYTTSGRLYMTKDVKSGIKYFYFYDELDRLNDVQISYNGTDIPPSSRIKVKYNLNNLVRNASYTYKGETKEANYTYYDGGLPQLTTFSGFANSSYGYDSLSRVNALTVYPINSETSWDTAYQYYNPTSSTSSNLISRISHTDNRTDTVYNIDYSYDKFGNIKTTTNEFNYSNTRYEYDYLNQLTRDNNSKSGKTTTYNYDNGGNILSKTIYNYTTGSLDGLTGTVVQYTYGDTNWKDKLTAYNGNAITYDSIGNPLRYYNGTTFEWDNGRQLARATKTDGTYMSYRYDDSGVRIRKSVNGVATDYLVDGTKIIAEKTGNNIIWYYYDAAGTRIGFTYNNTPYYYVYNAQGDVIGLYNSGQQIVARYNYDAWGKIVSITNQQGAEITDTTHIAHINPIRYRGYYYDTETGLYYVSSRYYDPEIGRWINADTTDILTATPMGLTDKNLFAYCDNNPVMRADHGGDFWHIVAGAAIGGLIGGISSIVGQAISGQKINWAEAGVSAASGALTGAITAACPGMGAVATGIVHGVVGAGTHVATELVNGRTPTVVGTLAAGVTSGVLAGGAKAICNRLTTTKLYRSVSTAEAKSFSSTGKFSAGTGQMEGKFFATTRANAKTWGSKLGSGNIISIRVPNSALSHSSVTYFPRLDAIGPAYYFSDLSYLNSVFR
ncbi:MAG: RHS repeat-associated core domain-containing protein, partial [Clostridia bacterium]|nr:RHS repeat-associated core domain-containing protein [Clostridia bacterium]